MKCQNEVKVAQIRYGQERGDHHKTEQREHFEDMKKIEDSLLWRFHVRIFP